MLCPPENIKTLYEKATTAPLPEPCPTPQPKRSKADLERDVRELEEEKENRAALRKHDVPGYFNSELGKAFLLAQVRLRKFEVLDKYCSFTRSKCRVSYIE